MSSILDALKKLEAAEAPPARAPAIPRERPRALGLTAAGIALAFGAGAGSTFFLRAGHAPALAPAVVSAPPQPVAAPSPPPPAPVVAVEPPPPPPAAAAVVEALPLAAPAAPLPQAAVDAEPPRATAGRCWRRCAPSSGRTSATRRAAGRRTTCACGSPP